MKKIVAALVLGVTASAAMAQHYHGHRHHGYHGGHWRAAPSANWILPAIIGGAIVYETTRPATVIIQQPQVVYSSNQPIVLPQPPQGYRWDSMIDPACNCSRFVLVPN